MNKVTEVEYLIIGCGMVGLSMAYQLLTRNISKKVICIDKEKKLGMHSSGRNSGVLHAGLYYQTNSLKAKLCVKGAKRLRRYVEERDLPINPCGKVIVPQSIYLDSQLDELARRGKSNGAKIEMWDKAQLKKFLPLANSSSGRALWSPNTCVVKPLKIIENISSEIKEKGGEILTYNNKNGTYQLDPEKSILRFNNDLTIKYKHIINCAGLNADKIAHLFGVGLDYKIMPFKGLYWELKNSSSFRINTNLYPVPDLNVPFLGVHFTPSADKIPKITIGPTATFAFGRENYNLFDSLEPISSLNNLTIIAKQYLMNKGGFRKYVHEQSLLSFPPLLLNAAKSLIPSIKREDIKLSDKVGIRSQLFNTKKGQLENDFICKNYNNSTHVLNAISPAFTASFELADYLIDNYII
tara:strand:+ start:27644 stop:28873 length:1230 start_codon:yes stop_codon:yes gene_type:complete